MPNLPKKETKEQKKNFAKEMLALLMQDERLKPYLGEGGTGFPTDEINAKFPGSKEDAYQNVADNRMKEMMEASRKTVEALQSIAETGDEEKWKQLQQSLSTAEEIEKTETTTVMQYMEFAGRKCFGEPLVQFAFALSQGVSNVIDRAVSEATIMPLRRASDSYSEEVQASDKVIDALEDEFLRDCKQSGVDSTEVEEIYEREKRLLDGINTYSMDHIERAKEIKQNILKEHDEKVERNKEELAKYEPSFMTNLDAQGSKLSNMLKVQEKARRSVDALNKKGDKGPGKEKLEKEISERAAKIEAQKRVYLEEAKRVTGALGIEVDVGKKPYTELKTMIRDKQNTSAAKAEKSRLEQIGAELKKDRTTALNFANELVWLNDRKDRFPKTPEEKDKLRARVEELGQRKEQYDKLVQIVTEKDDKLTSKELSGRAEGEKARNTKFQRMINSYQKFLEEGNPKDNSKYYNDMINALKDAKKAFSGEANAKYSRTEAINLLAEKASTYVKEKESQFRPFPSERRLSRLHCAKSLAAFAASAKEQMAAEGELNRGVYREALGRKESPLTKRFRVHSELGEALDAKRALMPRTTQKQKAPAREQTVGRGGIGNG